MRRKAKKTISVILTLLLFILQSVTASGSTYINLPDYKNNTITDNDDASNLSPYVDFSFAKKRKAELIVNIGNNANSAAAVSTKITNIVKPVLDAVGIGLIVKVESIGSAEINAKLPTLTWNGSTERYYVYITDYAVSELSDKNKTAEILKTMLENKTYFIGMGRAANKTQFESLIAQNSNNGMYIDNSYVDTAWTRLADYITGKKVIDLNFNIANGIDQDTLTTKINQILKPKLNQNNINAKITCNTGVTYPTINDLSISTHSTTNPHVFAVQDDGTVWAWGDNYYGQLGLGYTTRDPMNGSNNSITTPTKATYINNIGMGSIKKILAGTGFSIMLLSDGTVWTWGVNDCGQCGLQYFSDYVLNPTQVPGVNNISDIAVGYRHCLALTNSGNVYSWGGNDHGELGLGDDDIVKLSTPTLIPGFNNATKIYANSQASAAMKKDGTLWFWGIYSGWISSTPSTGDFLGDASTNVADIYIRGRSYFVLKGDGTVWAWGNNNSGQLGIGDVYSQSRSVKIPYIYNIKQAGLGNSLGFLVDNDNKVYLSGTPECGIFTYSDGTSGARNTPGLVTNMPQASKVYPAFPLMIIKNDGTVWGIGRNYDATLGNGTYDDSAGWVQAKFPAVPKTLNTIIQPLTWRVEADKYVININNQTMAELNDSTKVSNIADQLKSSNISYISFGSATNKAQQDNLITQNSSAGAYFDMSNLDQAISDFGDYLVAAAIEPSPRESDYMLVTDELEDPVISYSDTENDAYDNKWVFEHDPTHFISAAGTPISMDNSNGTFSLDKQTLSSPVKTFIDIDSNGNNVSKVGSYRIKYQAVDKPKGDDVNFDGYRRASNIAIQVLNVHRKPMAQYKASVTLSGGNYVVSLSDNGLSYDPDHTSRADKGIVNRIWGYALVTPGSNLNWNYTKTTNNTITYTLPTGSAYLLSLQVQDCDANDGYGAWSDPKITPLPDKPIAQFTINPNPLPSGSTLTVSDNSFVTTPGAAITQRYWTITKIGDTSFVYNNQPSCKTTGYGLGTYIIKLQVKDSNNLLSDFYSQILRVIDNTAPTISVTPTSRGWGNSDVSAAITANDTGGSGLQRIDYVWAQDSSNISDYAKVAIAQSPVTNTYAISRTQSATGIWYLCARAMDYSDNYSSNGNFNVYGPYCIDKITPNIDSIPTSGTSDTQIQTTVNVSDAGGSGIKSFSYEWTTSTVKPAAGWTTVNEASSGVNSAAVTTSVNTGGVWYLHMTVTDHAGNTYYRYRGPYEIQDLKINNVTIDGYWNHWRGQADMFGKVLTNEPHRFLSLEQVKINVYIQGKADKVIVRFSPELEAMKYTNGKGRIYDYKDDFFGHYVLFPQDSTILINNPQDTNRVTWEYALPLAPNTKSWDNVRERPPYSMTVTVFKGTQQVSYTVNDIELTGCIYDLTYIQPIN